jgi:probable HAF family extracellular repeat protein
MKLRTFGPLATVALVSWFLAGAASATTPLFRIIDLGLTGGFGINHSGVVVGISGGDVVLSNGTTITNLGAIGVPTAINASGQVMGYGNNPLTGRSEAFLYNGKTTIFLGTLGGSFSEGDGINASGEVVGASESWVDLRH